MAEMRAQGGNSFIVPAGETVHSGLRSVFVKMEGLLAHLAEEKFSGYVLLHGSGEDKRDTEGLLLLRGGQVVGAAYGDSWGEEAQERIGERVSYQAGQMDIVSLTPETVSVLAPSFGQRVPYTDLRTFFVDLDRLVLYLSGIGFSGSINVASKDGRGAVLLSGGRLVGFYTDSSPELTTNSEALKALWADGEGVIWVSSVIIR